MKKFIVIRDVENDVFALLLEQQEEEYCDKICYKMNTTQEKFYFFQLPIEQLEAFKKKYEISIFLKTIKGIN